MKSKEIKSYRNAYYLLLISTIILLISLMALRYFGLFDQITNTFLFLLILFVFLLTSNSKNIIKADLSKAGTSTNVLLATITIGDLIYIIIMAFNLGRMYMRTFI